MQESKLYGAHFREISADAPKAKKITFQDSDEEWINSPWNTVTPVGIETRYIESTIEIGERVSHLLYLILSLFFIMLFVLDPAARLILHMISLCSSSLMLIENFLRTLLVKATRFYMLLIRQVGWVLFFLLFCLCM